MNGRRSVNERVKISDFIHTCLRLCPTNPRASSSEPWHGSSRSSLGRPFQVLLQMPHKVGAEEHEGVVKVLWDSIDWVAYIIPSRKLPAPWRTTINFSFAVFVHIKTSPINRTRNKTQKDTRRCTEQ